MGSTDRNDPIPDAYARAGVDIAAGNALVDAIKPVVKATARTGSNPDLGGFGGLFDLAACGFQDPVLVAATDGVGTKLMLAIETDRLDGIGIDLVAMCVNDLVVQGAEPLFFLDYYATSKLVPEQAARVIASIATGCRLAGCALIGGETAEMPGLYRQGDFDLAGFAVGAAERGAILPRPINTGDVLLGLGSSGVHANGYSLVRRILGESGAKLEEPAPFDSEQSLAEILLEPTRIYVPAALKAVRSGLLQGLAHITGGGLIENVPRMLQPGQTARIDPANWPLPPVLQWLAHEGRLTPLELARTFNAGIGIVLACKAEDVSVLRQLLSDAGEQVFEIGDIVAADGPAATQLVDPGKAWPCCG